MACTFHQIQDLDTAMHEVVVGNQFRTLLFLDLLFLNLLDVRDSFLFKLSVCLLSTMTLRNMRA